MPRVLIVIENEMYIRNFILSGALDNVLRKTSCTIAVSDHPTKGMMQKMISYLPWDHESNREKIRRYTRSPGNINLVYEWNRQSMLHFSDRSYTFQSKVQHGWMKPPFTEEEIAQASSIRPSLIRSRGLFWRKIKSNPYIANLLIQTRPDFVLFPWTGVEATGYELLKTVGESKSSAKVIFLQNGWDNISSKGVLPMLPHALGCWGPQSMADAGRIHEMPSSLCWNIGCARYSSMHDARMLRGEALAYMWGLKRELPKGDFILFAGSTAPCDEGSILRALNDMMPIDNISTILYRPHPWREHSKWWQGQSLYEWGLPKHVRLDPQYEPAWGAQGVSSQSYPDLVKYYTTLSSARLVITPLSSVMIEAVLMGTPVIALAHDDGGNIPPSVIVGWEHLQGIERIKGIRICRKLDDLPLHIEEAMKLVIYLDKGTDHFLHTESSCYDQRVLSMMTDLEAMEK